MADEYIINGLVKRRALLTGDIENAKDNLKSQVEALEKLDATILMFDPDYKIEGIKPKSMRALEDWASRGEMTRIVMDTLRQATEPLTARDLAVSMMEIRGMDRDDVKLVRRMTKRVGGALRTARGRGLTKSAQGTGQLVLWGISK